jgi:hypothetical protein
MNKCSRPRDNGSIMFALISQGGTKQTTSSQISLAIIMSLSLLTQQYRSISSLNLIDL